MLHTVDDFMLCFYMNVSASGSFIPASLQTNHNSLCCGAVMAKMSLGGEKTSACFSLRGPQLGDPLSLCHCIACNYIADSIINKQFITFILLNRK